LFFSQRAWRFWVCHPICSFYPLLGRAIFKEETDFL
jgi:hypothetical protein